MRPRIFLVDDDALQLQLVAVIMRKAGFENIISFKSPCEALKSAIKRRPDLVITDYQMPELTGRDLLKRLKRIYPDLPTIVVSGSDLRLADIDACAIIQKGRTDYFEQLIKEVERALRDQKKEAFKVA